MRFRGYTVEPLRLGRKIGNCVAHAGEAEETIRATVLDY
jgi:hypothetical protein